MPFKIVILWTDALVFVLVAVAITAAWYVRRREHLRAPWRKVAHSRSGMCALVVLSVLVMIGFLDSLHFRARLEQPNAKGNVNYAVEVRSVFDVLVDPLGKRPERTYSAPLAAYAFSKETVTLPDGTQVREFPRLKFGGAHLKDPKNDLWPDILTRFVGALGFAAVLWIVITMLLTLGAILAVAMPLAILSTRYHVFGTDKVGQDVLYQALKSVRTGLVIGTLTTLVMLPFALVLGTMAGYFRGWVDDAITYVYTTLNSIPGVLLIVSAVLISQAWMDTHPDMFETVTERADLRLLFLCMILGITTWTGLCRLLRGEALKLREMDYVQAARAFGVSDWRILTRHLMPNVMHIVLITVVMDFSMLVLAEAVLSYVGVGVDPSMISFGTMINNARLELAREPMVWWSLAAAFAFMFVLVLCANLFADAVRDAFDPRVRAGILGLARARPRLKPALNATP
jgi:peptide/nickel transport system permease protein